MNCGIYGGRATISNTTFVGSSQFSGNDIIDVGLLTLSGAIFLGSSRSSGYGIIDGGNGKSEEGLPNLSGDTPVGSFQSSVNGRINEGEPTLYIYTLYKGEKLCLLPHSPDRCNGSWYLLQA